MDFNTNLEMKKILLFVAFLGTIFFSEAQGNLQFNQVINGSIDANILNNQVTPGSITVPEGKVWKIESVSYFSNPGTTYQNNMGNNTAQAWIGNHQVWAGNSNTAVIFPIWLSAGTFNIQLGQVFNSSTPVRFSWSVIEFNVVP